MATEKKAAPKKAAPRTSGAPKAAAAKPARAEAHSAPATETAGPSDARNALQKRRTVVGVVVSDKMMKTIVVKVDRRVKHGAYAKYVMKSRKFKAHDETNNAKIGDLVELLESRPLSRDKRWVLKNIIRRAGQAPEANV
jgi:small subunit ribosomal protein S17